MNKFQYEKDDGWEVFFGLLKLTWWSLTWIFFLSMVGTILAEPLVKIMNENLVIFIVIQAWSIAPILFGIKYYLKLIRGNKK
jgi:hypothetical protein